MHAEGVTRREVVFAVAIQLILCLMLAMGSVRASGATGGVEEMTGEVAFGQPAAVAGAESTRQLPVVLRGYVGKPMTAIQLTVVCDWPYRLEGVRRGTAIADSSRWRFFTEIRSGIGPGSRHGADTLRIVVLSTSLSGIGPVDEAGLLVLAIRPPAVNQAGGSAKASVKITEVIGALPTGVNAGLLTGSPQPLQVMNR